MKLMGIKVLIVTNAAGGINPGFSAGDVMLIKDHVNIAGFAGNNPLTGPNDERWGPRFPPMNKAYDADLRHVMRSVASELKMSSYFREGIYCMFGGPCYETVAEVKFIRNIGADAVGMSTIHEVITAAHCGLRVVALSLVTNCCVADENSREEANHEEVIAVGKKRAVDMEKLVAAFVDKIKQDVL